MYFTQQEIKVANLTCRNGGASVFDSNGKIRAIVPKYISQNVNKCKSILDYGAGRNIIHTKWLRAQGFNITAYDFGENHIEGLHDKNALNKRYDVIFASNVLNVQSSESMMETTLYQIYKSLKKGGEFIFNYPSTPRKMDMQASELIALISKIFNVKALNYKGVFVVKKQ